MVSVTDNDREFREDLFDNSSGYDEDAGVKLAPDLTEEERQQANYFYHLFNELWGLCIVKGDPGSGKDTFGNIMQYKLKRYFPEKHFLRDIRPRPLFGEYTGLFNEEVLRSDLLKMRQIAKGKKKEDDEKGGAKLTYSEQLAKAADDWVKGSGKVLLHNAILYLEELWNYCYNREPHKPINKTMGAVFKMKRHLDLLTIGSVQDPHDLDKYTCLPWVDWVVTATRSTRNKTGFVYYIQKVKYNRRINAFENIGSSHAIPFDAGKPRSEIGDGKIVVAKTKYRGETEEEQIVLKVLKAGLTNYEELVDYIESYGDMSEREILDTLKELKFRRRKRVVDYPCYFGLFNSKSAPNIKTQVKAGD